MDADRKGIIELRMGGGDKGAQTVFPGSTHEGGEPITWANDGEPARSTFAELKTAVERIAVGTLLMRGWPAGSGHEAAQAAGGFLARSGWDNDAIEKMVQLVTQQAGDLNIQMTMAELPRMPPKLSPLATRKSTAFRN